MCLYLPSKRASVYPRLAAENMEIEVLNARKEERRQERQELLQGPPAIPETLICHLQVEIRNGT